MYHTLLQDVVLRGFGAERNAPGTIGASKLDRRYFLRSYTSVKEGVENLLTSDRGLNGKGNGQRSAQFCREAVNIPGTIRNSNELHAGGGNQLPQRLW